ncbi:hypothetical protein P8610_10330 [Fictibacillus sp. UD]
MECKMRDSSKIELQIFFVRCVAAVAFLVLRDSRAGETLKSETLRMWLTACPAESEHLERKSTTFKSNKVCETT